MDSKIGLLIQLAGVSLITVLTLFLRRSVKVVALRHWTNAWLFLCFALFCLRFAFSYEQYSLQLFGLYFFTQYVFGFLLVAGCRSLSENGDMSFRQESLVLPLVVVSFAMPLMADDFNLIFNIHSVILSGFYLAALIALYRARLNTFGWRVMMVALALLIGDLFQCSVVYTAGQYFNIETEYLTYNSVIDLVLQTLLGFGMVIVLLELVLKDARIANEKLRAAHQQLQELAHVDPLTTALNRHAFHGYLKQGNENGPVSGCVGFFDIDDLKMVNDVHGHAVGDVVIRAVVKAIREIVRAEDLIFRWGGDEFFVLMIGLDALAANDRMSRMESMLTGVHVDGVGGAMTIGVSHAFENFEDIKQLEATIRRADAGMYLQKQIKKGLIDGAYPLMRKRAGDLYPT